jgi:putative membrane protein
MINTICDGLCMALADSVPGVSGGTIAYILGFYDRFIEALHDLFGTVNTARKTAAVYLLQLGVGWVPGMGICVLLLSNLFSRNIYFMSSMFLGLTAAAIPYVVSSEKQVLRGHLKNIPFLLLGIAVVVGITLLRTGSDSLGTIDFLHLQPWSLLYVSLAGMAAIAAMVLPGISGSTILLISGVYLPAINAIKQLLQLNFAMLPGLIALGMGVLVGIGLSVHCIRAALQKHRSQMVYLILGLMAGSLVAIAQGPATLAEPVPALDISSFNVLGFVIGAAILFGMESLRKAKADKKQSIKINMEETTKNGR